MKIATDFEQSQQLAKILPVESADMMWLVTSKPRLHVLQGESISNYVRWEHYPAWSLGALMCQLPNDEENSSALSRGMWTNDEYESKWCAEWEYHGNDDYHHELAYSYEPIDACVELIIKIHERKVI